MNVEQVGRVVGALAVSYGKQTSPEMFEVYEMALVDLPMEDGIAFVKRVVRTHEWWPSPAVLRKMILDDLGLLAPDEDQAWVMAKKATQSATVATLPEAVHEAVQAVGRWNILHGQETIVAAQFREAYRRSKSRADRETLERTHEGFLEVGYGRGRGLPAADAGGAP